MGTDTKALRDAAEWLKDDDAELDFNELHAWSRVCSDAADEIDVLRETAKRLADEAEALRKGGAGPSVEERLTRYRASALSGLLAAPDSLNGFNSQPREEKFGAWVAGEAEVYAHAMLAAERPAHPLPNQDGPRAPGTFVSGHAAGARAVLKRFDEWAEIIDYRLPLTREDMLEWSALVRREMGLGEG